MSPARPRGRGYGCGEEGTLRRTELASQVRTRSMQESLEGQCPRTGKQYKGQIGPSDLVRMGNGVGEPSRKTRTKLGGSDGTLRLAVPSVKRAEGLAGFAAVGDLRASRELSSGPEMQGRARRGEYCLRCGHKEPAPDLGP
jgi:hypothetical protein